MMTWTGATARLRLSLLIGGLLLLSLALLGYARLGLGQAKALDVFGDAPAFALTDHLERATASDEFRGTVVIANFIYTNCPDICPLLSFRMQALQDRLRQEGLLGGSVRLLSFTVDPARDTPPVLREYAERHRADPQAWRFLTGPEDVMVPLVVQGFRLGVQALPPQQTPPTEQGEVPHHDASYEVIHSGRFVLIDRQWRIRAYYDGTQLDLEQVVGHIRQLLP